MTRARALPRSTDRLARRRSKLRAQLDEVDREIADLAIRSKGVLPPEELAELVEVTRVALNNLMRWRRSEKSSRH